MDNPFKKIITVFPDKSDSYNIYIGRNVYTNLPSLLREQKVNSQIAVISVPPVSRLYMQRVRDLFDSKWQVFTRDVNDGEISKSMRVAQDLYTWLIENRFERSSTIIALGGGVVGDLAGFVAATYLRGIHLVHLPTSLLAQVDSSIGGKVGINHTLGKNLIGAFYQPKFVLTDTSVLSTLDDTEYLCGMGEVIKYGILSNNNFFQFLEENIDFILEREPELQDQIVQHCINQKAEIVSQDTYETGIRSSLNLGHSFGHALETYMLYKGLKHGQAVMLGIMCAVHASRIKRLISEGAERRITGLIKRIPVRLPERLNDRTIKDLLEIMKRDKKVAGGKINLIGIEDIGSVRKIEVTEQILQEAFYMLNDFTEG
jgi:3-dehydroquinate synthase